MNYYQRLKYVFKHEIFFCLLLLIIVSIIMLTSTHNIFLNLIVCFLFLFILHVKMYPKIYSNEAYDLPEITRRENFTIEEKCKQYIMDIYNKPIKHWRECKEIKCALKICNYHNIYDMDQIIAVAKIVDEYNYKDYDVSSYADEIYKEIVDKVFTIKL